MSTTTPRPDDLPADVLRHYTIARRIGYGSAEALDGARVLARWDEADAEGRVRLRAEPDPDPDLSFLDCEGWTETRQARAASASVRETASRDGVWIVSTEALVPACSSCRRGESWEFADSLGGLIGDVETEAGLPFAYRVDLCRAALALLDAQGPRPASPDSIGSEVPAREGSR